MKRSEAIHRIMATITDNVVFSSVGMISREVYQCCDRDRNFYCMGSMSDELGLALGLSYQRPELNVVVISGDGSALMSLNSLILHKKLNPPKLFHYILNNGVYASTGGQPTCSDCVDFEALAPNTKVIKVSAEKGEAPRIPLSCNEIRKRVYEDICLKK